MRLNRFIKRETAHPVPGHNICGVLVHTDPVHLLASCDALAQFPGVEIAEQADDGRLVLVVEDVPDAAAAIETIAKLHEVTGVASVSLVYHHCETGEPSASAEEKFP